MKLFHLGDGSLASPTWAHVHDAYHPLPAQLGEGRAGSGVLCQWHEASAKTRRTVIHAVALDTAGGIAQWHLKAKDRTSILEDAKESWALECDPRGESFLITERRTSERHVLALHEGCWRLNDEADPKATTTAQFSP